MKEIGTVMHVAGSGRVIIRLTGAASEGDILCDKNGTKVALIREIVGPVAAPYASAEPLTNNIKKHMGSAVGAITRKASGRSRRR